MRRTLIIIFYIPAGRKRWAVAIPPGPCWPISIFFFKLWSNQIKYNSHSYCVGVYVYKHQVHMPLIIKSFWLGYSFQNVDPFFLSSFGCVCVWGLLVGSKNRWPGRLPHSVWLASQPNTHKKGAAFEKKEHFILITSFHSLGFWYNGPCCCCQSQRKSIERREHSNGHQVQLPMSCWHTYIQPDPPPLSLAGSVFFVLSIQ